jgi:hypothetical protein
MHTFYVTQIFDGDTFAVVPAWKWNNYNIKVYLPRHRT